MARAKDLVAWVELGYVPANGFDLAGHIRPESRILWFVQSGHEAHDVRLTSLHVPVGGIEGSRANPD